jgi:hypothetical protein
MTQFTELPATSDPPRPATGPVPRGLIAWVCTNNPFYVLSAGLFLIGLRLSFGEQVEAVQTWTLMGSLASYTLLLAGTAWLLMRFGHVWDDARTVLLLVVLMFLATSVTFDEVLVLDPGQGMACYLGGLLFAVAVSEGLLRGTRLRLPAGFRLPYYLILALFFLYPLALSRLVDEPNSEALHWGLFGFSSVAGLLFLTLLPAIRRGPDYVRDNGSPWRWPLYPWVLFGLLAFAVPARAFLLCWSMHLLGAAHRDHLLFGTYFLVPFGLVLAVLLLEIARVAGKNRGVLAVALSTPAALAALTLVGHRPDPIYRGFLETFANRLGADPLYLALLACAGFYAYAALRRVSLAVELLTGALVVLAVLGTNIMNGGEPIAPHPFPLLAAAALQVGLGLRRRVAWRCLLGGGLVAGAALTLPPDSPLATYRGVLAFHLAFVALLVVGAAFEGTFARILRTAGALLVLAAYLALWFVPLDLPPWALAAYPLVLATFLAVYGLWLRHRVSLALAGLALVGWVGVTCWRGYSSLRQTVAGLDHIALSLALFGVAILISLAKSGVLARRFGAWGGRAAFEEMGGEEAEVRPVPSDEIQPG